jgi:diguanylate cyclase (GGDEF)-like protein
MRHPEKTPPVRARRTRIQQAVLLAAVSAAPCAVATLLSLGNAVTLGLAVAASAAIAGLFAFFTADIFRRLEAAQTTLSTLATTDEATGLYNRRHFFQRLEEEMDRAHRYGSNLSLIMLDIDHLRKINDTYGPPTGDVVLAEVGRLLKANLRASDIVARYGGEEFAVLIPGRGADEAAHAAEKLRVVMEVNDLFLVGPPVKVTISLGVSDLLSQPANRRTKDQLLRSADLAQGRAKSRGRNRVEVFRPEKARQSSLL